MRGLHKAQKRFQPLAIILLFLNRRVVAFDHLARARHVGGIIEQQRMGRFAIAACAPCFLIIGLNRFGQAHMHHKAHIGFVDPHAERNGGDHDHIFARHKLRLVTRARRIV